MASYTEKLNLLKKNPVTDGADTFNIETMMNENWDKIDGFSAFLEASIAPPYSASSAYAVGAWCTYYGKLYQCTTAIGSGGEAWNASHWTAKSTAELIAAVRAAIPSAYTSNPAMDGTASAGSSGSWARGDHVHPKDTSKADQSLLATYVRPNLMANGYFVGGGSQAGMGKFPVNQRGLTSYSNTSYSVDRWDIPLHEYYTLTVRSDCVRMTKTAASRNPVFGQSVPSGSYAKIKVTLSIMYKSVGNFRLRAVSSSNVETVMSLPQASSVSVASTQMYSADGFVNFGVQSISGAVNDYIDIYAMKLEIGGNQTLARWDGEKWVLNEIPKFEEELAKCQYCGVELNPFGVNFAGVGNGHAANSTTANIVIPLPVTMRVKPVVTWTGSWRLEPGNKSVTNIEVDYIEGNNVRLKVTSSGLSQGSFYALEAYNDSSARIFLSADY